VRCLTDLRSRASRRSVAVVAVLALTVGLAPAARAIEPIVPSITSFTAAASVVQPGQYASVSARVSPDLSNGYYLAIYDSSGTLLALCGSSGGCNAGKRVPPYTTETFTAYVVKGVPPTAGPPTGAAVTSSPVSVSTSGWTITSFTAADGTIEPGQYASISARVSPDLSNGYYLAIYDSSGTLLALCGSSGGCNAGRQVSAGRLEVFRAYVVKGVPPNPGPPPNAAVASGAVVVTTIPEDQLLGADPTLALVNGFAAKYAAEEVCLRLGQATETHALHGTPADVTLICTGSGGLGRALEWIAVTSALGVVGAVTAVVDAETAPQPVAAPPECSLSDPDGECTEEPGVPSTTPDVDPEPEPGTGAIGGSEGVAPPPNCLPPAARQLLEESMPDRYHHIATHYGEWGVEFQQLLERYGLSVTDGPRAWNVYLMPHVGPHPPEYHQWVLDNVRQADRIADGDLSTFLTLFDEWVVQKVLADPTIVRVAYWKCYR
jgi:hypothetical protein